MSSFITHNYFGNTHMFTSEMGLQVAFGIGEFSPSEKEPYSSVVDYGVLKAYLYYWDVDKDPIRWIKELKISPCSLYDLNLTDKPSNRFFPMN
jgi:hypothetical protein